MAIKETSLLKVNLTMSLACFREICNNVDSVKFCLQNTIEQLSYLLFSDGTLFGPYLIYFVSILWNV